MDKEEIVEAVDQSKLVDKLAIGLLTTVATVLVTGGVEKAYGKLVVDRRNQKDIVELED